jgi:hypothetical protein
MIKFKFDYPKFLTEVLSFRTAHDQEAESGQNGRELSRTQDRQTLEQKNRSMKEVIPGIGVQTTHSSTQRIRAREG